MIDAMQARDPNATCGNCPWFMYLGEPHTHGTCRLRPPTVIATSEASEFPINKPTEVCSQHPLNKIAFEKFMEDWRDLRIEQRRAKWDAEEDAKIRALADTTTGGLLVKPCGETLI